MKKKILFVHVDKSMEVCGQKKKREDEYQCIRKYWKLNADRANKADYVVGVANQKIVAVYRNISGWHNIGYFKDLLDDDEIVKNPEYKTKRFAFEGEEVVLSIEEMNEIEKEIPEFGQNPVRYNYE